VSESREEESPEEEEAAKSEHALYAREMMKEGENEKSSGETEWAMRAKLLDDKGKKLTIRQALKTDDGERFTKLYAEDFTRLITVQEVMHPINGTGYTDGRACDLRSAAANDRRQQKSETSKIGSRREQLAVRRGCISQSSEYSSQEDTTAIYSVRTRGEILINGH